jgi:hypothetical protein
MAEQTVNGADAVEVLESAVHLLRRTPLETLLYHWAGSVPFAVVFLIFWNDVSQYRTSPSTAATDAAVLTLGLIWMSCWRSLFAGRLRSQLSGDVYVRPSLGRLLSAQAFLGSTKLIVLPLAALTIVAFANVAAFYRYAAVLGGRAGEGDVFRIMSQAWRLSRLFTPRLWLTTLLARILTIAALLNFALVLIILPQLARLFTGVETEFSRIGPGLAATPLFWGLVFAVAWLASDPFIQAVYCVLCFRAESASSGEDLRASLQRLRYAATSAALFAAGLFAALPHLRAAGAVAPGELHDSIQQALKSHEYDWRLPEGAAAPGKPSWFVTFGEKVIHYLGVVLKSIGKLIGKILDWIFGKLSGIMPSSQGGSAPASALHWSVYALTAAIVLLAGFLIWRIVRNRRRKAKPAAAAAVAAVSLDDENVTPDRLPENQWIEMAEECLRKGDYRLALRAFYLANLAYLGRRELLTINAGKTNREYENELRRRARGAVEARDLFRANLLAFERVWYGLHDAGVASVEEFRERNALMKAVVDPPREAAA